MVALMAGAEMNFAGEAQDAPIDFNHLSRFTLGDKALEQEVLELFRDHAPVCLDRLRDATGVKDWHEAAHTLKGSAAAVGAWRVAELAADIEVLKDNPDAIRRARAIRHLQEAVTEASGFIGEIFPQLNCSA